MLFAEPLRIDVNAPGPELDLALEDVPAGSGVYLLRASEGKPHLGRTRVLKRRLKRLLADRGTPSRLLNLRSVVRTIELYPTASTLESNLIYYHLAREWFPDDYLRILKLRFPSYVKLILSDVFPRTQVTQRLSGAEGARYYGPFRSRALAEEFEHQMLDLFQLRRCQETLQPSPGHPGCIYGEMNMCLRPCQEVVGPAEYASEAQRVADFLETNGRQLLQSAEAARDRLSQELDFEGAAREHKRADRIAQALKMRDDLSCEVSQLNGIAITRSLAQDSVELWMMTSGAWTARHTFDVGLREDSAMSLDARLRELLSGAFASGKPSSERQEHVALLVRWFFSSWRDGEWITVSDPQKPSIRKLVGAISRVAAQSSRT